MLRTIHTGECVPLQGWAGIPGKEHRGPPTPAAGASLSTWTCLPQACPIVCDVLGPGTVPVPTLRLSNQSGEGVQHTLCSCCRGFFVSHNPPLPPSSPFCLWGPWTSRSPCPCAEENHPDWWVGTILGWGGSSGKGAQGPTSSCCRGYFVTHDPAYPDHVLLSVRSLVQEQFLLLHWEDPPRVLVQQGLDQNAKTLLAAFEGRDGQAPMQEFLQQPERQHDITRVHGSHNKKIWISYSRRSRRNQLST